MGKDKDKNKERYLRYKAEGRCGCGRTPEEGRKICVTCTENARYYGQTPSGVVSRKIRVSSYYQKNKEYLNQKKMVERENNKIAVMLHYGGECSCCGEDGLPFLSIDHINGDGADRRRNTKQGVNFYKWIIDNKFPPDLQVLCISCNFAKGTGEVCLHKLGTLLRLSQLKEAVNA